MKHTPHHHVLKVSRLTSLTDGIFAIAMTILILDVHLPPGTSTSNLLINLKTYVAQRLFIYAGSFIILGTHWVGMNFQHGFLHRVCRPYMWANIFYLLFICIIPFSASLVASYLHSPISISFYAINLLCASLMQLVIFQVGHYFKLFGYGYSDEIRKAVLVRVLIPPTLYLISLFLAYWNTTVAFITLIIPPLFHIIPGKVDKYTNTP